MKEAPTYFPSETRLRVADALALQRRVIFALFLRETRTRFGATLLGYGWALLTPALNILVWALLFTLATRPPLLGDSLIVFTSTALLPFMLFSNMATRMLAALTANRALLQFPVVHNVDVLLARGLLELVTGLAVCGLFFLGYVVAGLAPWPAHPLQALCALLALGLWGFGLGVIFAVVACLVASLDKITPWLMRLAYLTCGVFFLPAMLPRGAQNILWFLPWAQGVEWFRAALFVGYHGPILSKTYLIGGGLLVTTFGLALERAMRRRISVDR